MKYLSVGTVSLLGFLLATACGQGGPGGGGQPPSLDDDGVPDNFEDLPPPAEVVPNDPARPLGPTVGGVPNNQGDPPAGGGVSCRQYCSAVLATGCPWTSEDGQEREADISAGDCATLCAEATKEEPCVGSLLGASLCFIQLLPAGSCSFDELDEEQLLQACYTPLIEYVECAGLDTGEPGEPGEPNVPNTPCGRYCEESVSLGCTSTIASCVSSCESAYGSVMCGDEQVELLACVVAGEGSCSPTSDPSTACPGEYNDYLNCFTAAQ